MVSIPDERVGGTLGEYHLTQLLSFIGRHAAEIGEARVARIELNFLSHLRLKVPTMALHRTLSTSPEFFVEIVSLRCRRRHGEADDTPEELDPTRALTAYRLLDRWALPPGTNSDGITDAKSCGDWIEAAKELLQKADRFEIGMDHIGKALSNWRDGDTEWPSRGVADVIEQVAEDRMDTGVSSGLVAQRGPWSRGVGDGGEQECVLARSFPERAAPLLVSHPESRRSWRVSPNLGRYTDA